MKILNINHNSNNNSHNNHIYLIISTIELTHKILNDALKCMLKKFKIGYNIK